MPVESLFPALEPLLARVTKPIQYVGGELNSTVKDWDAVDVRYGISSALAAAPLTERADPTLAPSAGFSWTIQFGPALDPSNHL